MNKLSKFFKNITSKNKSKKFASDTLPPTGRSSVDVDTFTNTLSQLSNVYGVINPLVPFEMLHYLKLLGTMNPNVSQAVKNFRNIGNSGHRILIKGDTRTNETVIDHLNEKAATFCERNGGIDGFVNQLFDALCIDGAFDFEAVLKPSLDEIDTPVIVPVSSIRFKYENGKYVIYQQPNGIINAANFNLIPLNPVTNFYFGLPGIDNSPYAVPPFLAALEPAGTQQDMIGSIKRLIKKAALLGFLDIGVKPLEEEPGETPEQYKKRYQKYIDLIDAQADKALKNGRFTRPEDISVNFVSVAAEVRGFDSLWVTNEQQFMSGLNIDPAMMGRTYSTTETYAGVVYEVFLKNCANMRILVKRGIERLYFLECLLQNLPIQNISIRFNKDKSLNPEAAEQAENYRASRILKNLFAGVISPDQAAQELGYDTFFDLELFKQKALTQTQSVQEYSFDTQTNKYTLSDEFKAARLLIQVKQSQQAANEEKKRAQAALKELQSRVEKYLGKVLPYFNELQSDVTDYALNYTMEHLEDIAQDSTVLLVAVKKYIENQDVYKNIANKESWFREISEPHTIDAGKYFLESDWTAFGGNKPSMKFTFGQGDLEAMKFYSRLDQFYFSKLLSNDDFGNNIKSFINRFLERGEALQGQWTNAVKKEFIRLFGSALGNDFNYQAERIINSSISNIRVRSHIIQLHEVGFKYGRINGVLEACPICKPLHGKKILISAAREVITKFESASTPEEALQALIDSNISSEEEANDAVDNDGVIQKNKICPFHIKCKCFVEGEST
jgi:hypothetical protein